MLVLLFHTAKICDAIMVWFCMMAIILYWIAYLVICFLIVASVIITIDICFEVVLLVLTTLLFLSSVKLVDFVICCKRWAGGNLFCVAGADCDGWIINYVKDMSLHTHAIALPGEPTICYRLQSLECKMINAIVNNSWGKCKAWIIAHETNKCLNLQRLDSNS